MNSFELCNGGQAQGLERSSFEHEALVTSEKTAAVRPFKKVA